MNKDEAKNIIFGVLADIAPEVDRAKVDHSLDLTEQLDLDSMDYLNWMLGINQATGIEISQRDVSAFLTIEGAADYLVLHGT
ncbi:MAG TPA: acyl carrier protein [Acidimicrobiia bacterium]|nr:acyl carrier protein [Acidimicrobiia bacterium]